MWGTKKNERIALVCQTASILDTERLEMSEGEMEGLGGRCLANMD